MMLLKWSLMMCKQYGLERPHPKAWHVVEKGVRYCGECGSKVNDNGEMIK